MGAITDTIKESVKNWWWFVVKGLLLIFAGIVIFSKPAEGYVGLSWLFTLVIFGAGLAQIFFALSNTNVLKGWGWTFASGVIDVIVGIYLLSYPIITLVTLPYILGFWLIFRSFYLMGSSFDLQTLGVPGWGWILAGGMLLLILSFVILYFPAAGAISIVGFSASAFIVAGVFNIALAYKLKSIKKDVGNLENTIKQVTGLH